MTSIQMSELLKPWTPSLIPTLTATTSINTDHYSDLVKTLTSATERVATETVKGNLFDLSQIIRGAEASLTVLSAERVMATATASSELSLASQAIFNATVNLKSLDWEMNLYSMNINRAGNLILFIAFALLFLAHIGFSGWSRNIYMGVCLGCGCGLELAGYIARALAYNDTANVDKYLCQIICLTLAPVFIAAGIYFYLGQIIVFHGRQYSILKPTWYTYIFVFCDIVSLVIQAVGGGMAATALKEHNSLDPGSHTMLGGVVFQVFTMSVFLILLFDFINRTFFKANPEIKFSVKKFFQILLNTPEGIRLREKLDPYYNPIFSKARSGVLYKWIPFALLVSTIFVYIRCIYRVVELAEGWTGNLITHEVYLAILDALMIFLACFVLAVLHPMFTIGKLKLSFREIKRHAATKPIEEQSQESQPFDSYSKEI
ncbi:uncharacterized protein PRCAT00005584001 [Priceomyces carsonii]|uniref:uncharacterized protein n=1 Tax=Priceomyces carsonii TaxID=28549 RepID=UPI002ED82F9E|nr:unnamed protein product [Priceomyces carsonii]